jgi:hypothetical protein
MYDFVRRMVHIYKEHIKDTCFEATFHVNGVRVDVRMVEDAPKQYDEDDARVDG